MAIDITNEGARGLIAAKLHLIVNRTGTGEAGQIPRSLKGIKGMLDNITALRNELVVLVPQGLATQADADKVAAVRASMITDIQTWANAL